MTRIDTGKISSIAQLVDISEPPRRPVFEHWVGGEQRDAVASSAAPSIAAPPSCSTWARGLGPKVSNVQTAPAVGDRAAAELEHRVGGEQRGLGCGGDRAELEVLGLVDGSGRTAARRRQ